MDDYSRMTSVYFMKDKSQVLRCFDIFRKLMEKKTGQQIKALRSDQGSEYTSKAFSLYCEQSGIDQQFTTIYTPQQNGVSERANRTLEETAKCMMQYASLNVKFWAEAISTAVYLKNRSPHSSIEGSTPFQLWYGTKPNVKHFRVFG